MGLDKNGVYTFRMPAYDVTVVAEFEKPLHLKAFTSDEKCEKAVGSVNIDPDDTYMVIHDEVRVTVEENSEYDFLGWYPVTAESDGLVLGYDADNILSDGLSYSFEMTDDTVIVAVFKEKPPVDPTDPTGSSDPIDPTGSSDPTVPTGPTDPTDPTDPTHPSGGTKISIKSLTITTTDAVYTGAPAFPILEVTNAKGEIINPMNYKITYADPESTAVGTYEYTITGKGLYYGSVTNQYRINPPAKAIKKLKKGKKPRSFIVKWGKATEVEMAGFDGYQVKYSAKKIFKKYKTKIVKKNTAKKVRVKRVKRNKAYFVQIRTYKDVDGIPYYSEWSQIRKIKTRK